MPFDFTYLPYNSTNAFSQLVNDYLQGKDFLQPFYKYDLDINGIQQSIKDRSRFSIDRTCLVETINEQYKHLFKTEKLTENIALLSKENTFTVCTAHQPNLLTGYLYFFYKIIHAIKLAEELKQQFPENNFVPVYYMGSEDNDLDELGTFRYNGQKFTWDGNGQTGAVGRMKTESLKPFLHELFKILGPPGDHCDELKRIISEAYFHHATITEATQYLVNELFGKYGLVIINPDDHQLKKQFVDVMKDELLFQRSHEIVAAQISKLNTHYKTQAQPRNINLFYLKDDIRERIEKHGDHWVVLNTIIHFTEAELIKELEEYPKRFSPNVILRGLFQEAILPNVAFIGGGSEVAYWFQLKTLFEHYGYFFPVIYLRQSCLWINAKQHQTLVQLGLTVATLFKNENELIREYLLDNNMDDWQTQNEMNAIEQILSQLKEKAVLIDHNMQASADATTTKIKKLVLAFEKKMLRAEKRKMETKLSKITKLRSQLFPNNSLQERVDNFMDYYLNYGVDFIEILKQNIKPFEQNFLIIEEHHN